MRFCLARALTSANGTLTLAHVQAVAPKPAPDSGAAGAAARRRDALERVAALPTNRHSMRTCCAPRHVT